MYISSMNYSTIVISMSDKTTLTLGRDVRSPHDPVRESPGMSCTFLMYCGLFTSRGGVPKVNFVLLLVAQPVK